MRLVATVAVGMVLAYPLSAQSNRGALAAGHARYLMADYRGAVPLLAAGLDPAGPRDEQWHLGVQRLADALLALRHDSLATVWLRWVSRIAPDFTVDTEIMPPAVVRAAQEARSFVHSTHRDRMTPAPVYHWAGAKHVEAPAVIELSSARLPITARIGTDQFVRAGESRPLPSGSYSVVVSAPGYLPARLTVELLPGVRTVVSSSLLPESAGLLYVAARPWRELFINDERVGHASLAAYRLAPGKHSLRLVRGGFPPIDTTFSIAEREIVRLSWVTRAEPSGSARLDSAFALLDVGETERGALMLDRFLAAEPPSSAALRARALARLADAMWSLGARDSARARLRELVATDLFEAPPVDVFHPELRAAYTEARRAATLVAIRAPADTELTTFGGELPLRVAVGSPGEVRLVLRILEPRPQDSLIKVLTVDSQTLTRVSLLRQDSTVLAGGSYAIEASAVRSPQRATDLIHVTIHRLHVDTVPHPPPLPAESLRPERRRGRPTVRTAASATGLAAFAVAMGAVANDRSLSGRLTPRGAVLVGGATAIASLVLDRPEVPISSNIAHNEALRLDWQKQLDAVRAENARRVRQAPLRVRTSGGK